MAIDPVTGAEGAGAHAEAFEAWRDQREREGRRVTLIDLYTLVAEARGLQAAELPLTERRMLWELAAAVIAPGIELIGGSDRPAEPIEVVVYDAEWPEIFDRWRSRLASSLGNDATTRIEHVGSTSVPGLDAKPIVDIQVSVANLCDEHRYVPGCEAVGLLFRLRDDEHRFFRPPFAAAREVHVHVCEGGSRWEREHLLFRDFVRLHRDARDTYAAAKRGVAAVWRDDRIGYTEAKSAAILDILDSAEQWAQLNGWQP